MAGWANIHTSGRLGTKIKRLRIPIVVCLFIICLYTLQSHVLGPPPPPPEHAHLEDVLGGKTVEELYNTSADLKSDDLPPRPPTSGWRRPQDQHGRLPPRPLGIYNAEPVQIQEHIYDPGLAEAERPPLHNLPKAPTHPKVEVKTVMQPVVTKIVPVETEAEEDEGEEGDEGEEDGEDVESVEDQVVEEPEPPKEAPYMSFRRNWKPPEYAPKQTIPRIQFDFPVETDEARREREAKRDAVKESFLWSWRHYRERAWGHDETKPVTGGYADPFNGWGATIADSLGTLLLLGLENEYAVAREHIRRVNFNYHTTSSISFFETVIRYLGGMISAYDLSGDKLMLYRAQNLADTMLKRGFNTLTGVPPSHISLSGPAQPEGVSTGVVILAECGSFTLEFTRLAQITGNATYFEAVHRIMDFLDTQLEPSVWHGGLLPQNFGIDTPFPQYSRVYTLGAQADSYYEYLIKQHLLTEGQLPLYQRLYTKAIDSAHDDLLKETYMPKGGQVLGQISPWYNPRLEHLTCFAGGMLAMGAKALQRPKDLDAGIGVGKACAYVYEASPTGIGPEIIQMALKNQEESTYDVIFDGNRQVVGKRPKPIPGTAGVNDGRYLLRPETVETMFYLYRITGDKIWQDKAWAMYQGISKFTRVPFGHTAISNVLLNDTSAIWLNNQESFAFAELFKYLYLIFSEPDFVSLDDYVFNTEAHPFVLPQGKAKVGEFWHGDKEVGDPAAIGLGTPIQLHRQGVLPVHEAAAKAPQDPANIGEATRIKSPLQGTQDLDAKASQDTAAAGQHGRGAAVDALSEKQATSPKFRQPA